MKPQRKREIVTLIIVFTGVLLMSGIVVYLIGNRGTSSEFTQVEQPAAPSWSGRTVIAADANTGASRQRNFPGPPDGQWNQRSLRARRALD